MADIDGQPASLEKHSQASFPESTMPRFHKKPSSSAAPTNNPPSTSTSPIVEYIKKEFATFYPEVKDPRALVASSSTIALSIASPGCDPTDFVSDEPSRESAWRTAYGAAKMAIDGVKESSDVFPPLKAVASAISFLIKNYDVGHSQASRSIDPLNVLCSKPPPMRNKSKISMEGYSRLLRYLRPQLVTMTPKRRHKDGPL